MSVRPSCPASLAGHGLLMASEDAAVLRRRRPPCSTGTQDGEEATEEDEEEKGRGRSGGEAGGPGGPVTQMLRSLMEGFSRGVVCGRSAAPAWSTRFLTLHCSLSASEANGCEEGVIIIIIISILNNNCTRDFVVSLLNGLKPPNAGTLEPLRFHIKKKKQQLERKKIHRDSYINKLDDTFMIPVGEVDSGETGYLGTIPCSDTGDTSEQLGGREGPAAAQRPGPQRSKESHEGTFSERSALRAGMKLLTGGVAGLPCEFNRLLNPRSWYNPGPWEGKKLILCAPRRGNTGTGPRSFALKSFKKKCGRLKRFRRRRKLPFSNMPADIGSRVQ
ncbi:hypothetical protein EYF80_006150 [Liparis tanakae]|uniref:Uncharacterized protein n=1 Tax=Liparis tanakae TaxID=230148 RepID=A0A4Z2J2C2_9TELE|nr:hypothetical protein EYF80_006150 [Liparis tanakae]